MSKKPTKPSVQDLIRSTLEGDKVKAEAARLKKENAAFRKETALAREMAGIVEAVKHAARPPKPIKATKKELLHKRVATPVFLCSDWHVEETVKAEKVAGVNAYNLEIAARRVARLFEAQAWMIEHNRTSFEIREVVLALLGDLLSGFIHEELMEGNGLSPVQTIVWLHEHISKGISRLLAIPGLERIVIPCMCGNHGRTTHKIRIATGTENSFEWLLYQQLRGTFSKESRVEFVIGAGDFLRLDVHETKLGFHHGHLVKYNGGVGGVQIPLNKALARWNTYGACDLWNVGHFHQLDFGTRAVVNGSLIGTGPFGMAVGSYEEPAQASYLVDAKRGPCMYTPLWPEGSDFTQAARKVRRA